MKNSEVPPCPPSQSGLVIGGLRTFSWAYLADSCFWREYYDILRINSFYFLLEWVPKSDSNATSKREIEFGRLA
jgi:hypothetical protein